MNAIWNQMLQWDWKTIGMIASPIISGIMLLLALTVHHYNRRESRLQALSELLRPFVEAMQKLSDARARRVTCEQLKRAYPNPEQHPEVVERVNSNVEVYGELLDAGSQQCKTMERELAACRFRFPDRIASLLKVAMEDLFRIGTSLNEGRLDRAELQIAKCKDHYAVIHAFARGWRLSSPFEGLTIGIRKLVGRKRAEPTPRFDIERERMNRIMDLVHLRATAQAHNSYVVHPPKKLLDNPAIAETDDVIAQLEDCVFEVVFQDGTYEMMNLPEMMVFTYQLICLAVQFREVSKFYAAASNKDFTVSVQMSFSVEEIMRPEMVKLLLSKIVFSESPSDGDDAEVIQA